MPFHNENTQIANDSQDRPLSKSEVMQLIKQEMCAREPTVAAYNTPYTNSDAPGASFQQEKPLEREDMTQIIRQELSSFEPKIATHNTLFTSGHTKNLLPATEAIR